MTPIRLVLLRDRRTFKSFWVRLTGRAMPSLVNPDGPEETQDSKGSPAPTIPPRKPDHGPKPC